MVLKVVGEDLDSKVNRKQKGFVWMRCSLFLGSIRVNGILIGVFKLKYHGFKFIGNMCNEKHKYFSYFRDNDLKFFSGVNWGVGRFRYWSVAW